jgi:hypothetical protein
MKSHVPASLHHLAKAGRPVSHGHGAMTLLEDARHKHLRSVEAIWRLQGHNVPEEHTK